MAKTINATLPDAVHREFRIERGDRETTNHELLTEILAEHYELDATEAVEQLREENADE